MITRTFKADFLNSVINDPAVREGAEVKGIGDLSDIARNLNNYVLVTEFGGFVGVKKMAGLYECHTQFLPEGRGPHAVQACQEALRYMFFWTDCERLITRVKVDNKPAQHLAAQFFKKRGRTGDHFYYSMNLDEWVPTDAECQAEGEKFHALIEEKKNHEDDKIHDCFVGFTWLAGKTGNIYKGQLHYNRWAIMAGYEPLIILSERPLIVSVGSLQLAINQEGFTCL